MVRHRRSMYTSAVELLGGADVARGKDPSPPNRRVADSPFVSFMPFKPLMATTISSPISKLDAALAQGGNDENADAQQRNRFMQASPRRSPRIANRDAEVSRQLVAAAPSPAATTITGSATTTTSGVGGVVQHEVRSNKKSDLAQLADLIKRIKQPTAPSNVFLPVAAITHRQQTGEEPDAKMYAAPDWEALPAGTRLNVWWEGHAEYFECIIRDWHVAVGEGGRLFYTHRCEYEYGTYDHDLSTQSFEVLEVAPLGQEAAAGALSAAAGDGAPSTAADATVTPKRRWLAKQEQELLNFSEELENADIATPVSARQNVLRGRLALRRVSQPNVLDLTPRQQTPRAADGSVLIVDPSDGAVTYRMPVGIATTPRSALLRTPRGFTSKKSAAAAAKRE